MNANAHANASGTRANSPPTSEMISDPATLYPFGANQCLPYYPFSAPYNVPGMYTMDNGYYTRDQNKALNVNSSPEVLTYL